MRATVNESLFVLDAFFIRFSHLKRTRALSADVTIGLHAVTVLFKCNKELRIKT